MNREGNSTNLVLPGQNSSWWENFWADWAENTRSVKEVQYKLIMKA